MTRFLLEIVQLKSGEIVLKRADDDGAPLISISFSEESKSYIGESGIDIAKVMIQAGIQAAAQIHNAELEDEEIHESDKAEDKPKLH